MIPPKLLATTINHTFNQEIFLTCQILFLITKLASLRVYNMQNGSLRRILMKNQSLQHIFTISILQLFIASSHKSLLERAADKIRSCKSIILELFMTLSNSYLSIKSNQLIPLSLMQFATSNALRIQIISKLLPLDGSEPGGRIVDFIRSSQNHSQLYK